MEEQEKHSCKENLKLSGENTFNMDSVFFYGNCEICDKKLVETYKYVNTREVETDKEID